MLEYSLKSIRGIDFRNNKLTINYQNINNLDNCNSVKVILFFADKYISASKHGTCQRCIHTIFLFIKMFNFLNNFFSIFDFTERHRTVGDRGISGSQRKTDEGNQSYQREGDSEDKTIVYFSPHAFKNVVSTQDSESHMAESPALVQQKNYKIRLAQSKRSFKSACLLVQHMYLQKGYVIPSIQKLPDHITLTASQDGAEAGTITLGIDTGNGLQADVNYKQEVDSLRAEGRHICELTKFAVEQTLGSKPILAALFHIAYIYAGVLQKQTDVVIEVTPRHAQFYKRMLGFEQLGSERLNSRVNTTGVLLRLEIEYVDRQIERWGGKADQALKERSLYPYFFSKEDGAGITQRLLHSE